MTKEEKNDLIVALCGYLPYGVWVEFSDGMSTKLTNVDLLHKYNKTNYVQEIEGSTDVLHDGTYVELEDIRPYLRPMVSMTDEEKFVVATLMTLNDKTTHEKKGEKTIPVSVFKTYIQFLNKHFFDYSNLIERGLALKAPKDMYEISYTTTGNE